MLLVVSIDRVQCYVGATKQPRTRLLAHRRSPVPAVLRALQDVGQTVDDLLWLPLDVVPDRLSGFIALDRPCGPSGRPHTQRLRHSWQACRVQEVLAGPSGKKSKGSKSQGTPWPVLSAPSVALSLSLSLLAQCKSKKPQRPRLSGSNAFPVVPVRSCLLLRSSCTMLTASSHSVSLLYCPHQAECP